jgi:hypothetical protein
MLDPLAVAYDFIASVTWLLMNVETITRGRTLTDAASLQIRIVGKHYRRNASTALCIADNEIDCGEPGLVQRSV